jgi:hypothetical protein
MRVSAVALALLVGAGAARADSPLEAYAPLKVVGLMPDTSQALLWDEPAGEYRLAKVGDTLEGWKVLEISARDKRVTVGQDDVRDDLALTRLPRPNAMITYSAKVVAVGPKVPTATAAAEAAAPLPTPIPPTATVAPGPTPPAGTDMLAAPGAPAPAESSEPLDPYAPGVPAAGFAAAPIAAPVGAEPAAPSAPLDPYAPQAAPTVTPAQPTVIADGPESNLVVERHAVRRTDLDREINDFDRLMATVRVAPASGGGFVIARLEPNSFPVALGLRQGDVVRSIAGQPVSNIDDAARVYARLRSASSFVVEVQRGSRRFLLNVDIR